MSPAAVKGSHSPDALSAALWGWVSPAASRAKVRSMAEASLPLGLPGSAMVMMMACLEAASGLPKTP